MILELVMEFLTIDIQRLSIEYELPECVCVSLSTMFSSNISTNSKTPNVTALKTGTLI